jgi:hypothetical protein
MKNIYTGSDFHITITVPECRTETPEEWYLVQRGKLLQIKEIVGDDLFILAGDQIDVGKPLGAQIITNMYADCLPKNTIFIAGNHELRDFSQQLDVAIAKGSLGTMIRTKGLTYLTDAEPFEWGDYVIYGFNFGAGKTLEHRDVDKTKKNIAIGHFLSYAKKVPFYVKGDASVAEDIVKEFPEFDAIIVGDNHSTFTVNDKYLSPGSITRRTTKQIKHMPCIHRFDGEKFTPIYLKIKESSECITTEHTEKAYADVKRMQEWADNIPTDQEYSGNFKEDTDNYFISNEARENTQAILDKYIAICEAEMHNEKG